MPNEDTVQYALENTRVLRAPERRIATFGQTSFRFFLVSELMDTAHRVRIRDGRLHAERPQIITPGHIQRMLLEGFGEKAGEFVSWLRENEPELAVMKYGFQFRKSDVTDEIVSSTIEQVVGRLCEDVDRAEDPMSAIIEGVDEGWEICLLKFATDMIQESAGENLRDYRRRGLL